MIRSLVLLLDLLTNYQTVEALARDVFTFGLVNTGVAVSSPASRSFAA